MAMIKTYRRDESGTLFYREAWDHDDTFVVHTGKVGHRGRVRHSPIRSSASPDSPTADEHFREFSVEAAADGFAEIPDDEHGWVVLQFWTITGDLSHPKDAWILDEGEAALNTHLGWLGLGECDGHDIGGASPAEFYDGPVINLFCPVVDVPLGVKAVRSFVRSYVLGAGTVIGSRDPGVDSEYVLAWSQRKGDTTFTLL